MPESGKTMVYVGAAVLVLIAVSAVRFTQSTVETPVDKQIGEVLFSDLKDALDAKSLEIVQYDSGLAQLKKFKVEKRNGVWVIPSHNNYPADASERLSQMAAELMNVKKIGVASESAKTHEEFGVIEPDDEALKGGEEGVGELIRLQDSTGKVLAAMIIGKEVRDSDGQRYVRAPGQDTVFVANVDPKKFSDKFSDWIETDLLDFNPFDLDSIFIREYSIIPTPGGLKLDERSEIGIRQENSTWELTQFEMATPDGWGTADLMAEEELNQDKLNELKRAIDQLEIVDVDPKPKSLAETLANNEMRLDPASVVALRDRGFQVVPVNQSLQMFADNGELVLKMKEGYQYTLRFGAMAGLGSEDSSGVNRYVFVTASLISDHFPKPKPPTLPELPSADAPAPAPPGSDDSDAETSAGDASAPDSEQPSDADKRAEIEAERKRLQAEYDRELKKWEEEKSTVEQKVRTLQYRLSGWFFIVSEDVFQKLHLGRDDIIREKATAATEGFGVDAFRALEEGGLKKQEN